MITQNVTLSNATQMEQNVTWISPNQPFKNQALAFNFIDRKTVGQQQNSEYQTPGYNPKTSSGELCCL